MSDISVSVTNAGAAAVSVSGGSTVNATVGNGGSVSVATGTISPGNATVVAGTVQVNSTTTLAAGSKAYVTNNGTAYAASLDFGIPAGPATSVTVGSTTTLSAGSNATVTATTSGSNLTLAFGIPSGTTPAFSATATTLSAGSDATVSATTTNNGANVALAFGIPSGKDGAATNNLTLSSATPSALGTAAAGTSTTASRSDHVHQLPQLVSAVNGLSGSLTLAAGSNVSLSASGSTITVSSTASGVGADDTVDGGTYVGTMVSQSITITGQPTNQTATGTSYTSTAYTLPSGTWGFVSAANGILFATPNDTLGGDYIATSTNGTTWTKRIAVLPYAGQWSKVVYGNGVYVTFLIQGGPSGSWCATSTDGVTWTGRQISTTSGLALFAHSFLTAGGGWFVASKGTSGSGGTWVQSQDGVTWTTVTQSTGAGLPVALRYVTPSGDGTQLMAWNQYEQATAIASVTSSGVGQFSSSGLAIYMEPGVANSQCAVVQIIHDGTTFVAVGFNAVSEIGISSKYGSETSWTAGQFAASMYSVAYRAGRYVACTATGVASSTDALTWVLRQSGFSGSSGAVIASSGGYYASVGTTSGWNAFTSTDGLTWTYRTAGGYVVPRLVFDGKILVATASASQTGLVVDIGGLLSATFTVSAQAAIGSPTYQWQTGSGSSWSNVSGATSTSLVLSNLTTANNGTQYRAVVSASGTTSVNSNSATLTVN